MRGFAALLVAGLLLPRLALAVPGPDLTVVIANSNEPASIDLAQRYAAVRDVPQSQVCLLALPSDDVIDFATFETDLVTPLHQCLGDSLDRIEAALLIRGVPLNVRVPGENGTVAISVAAALQSHRSEAEAGGPLLGVQPPCTGSPCAAAVRNPYRSGVFSAGFESTAQGFVHRPWLVTMLNAYSYEDAAMLVASATTAEALGGPNTDIIFMDGANAPRAVLDNTFGQVMRALTDIGLASERVTFDREMTGRTIAAFVTGSQTLGQTVEGNTYQPGAIVDNLTSFGAVPVNFDPAANESQVSIARWVALGVAGVHGTTGEPLNNVFPSRFFIVDYFAGSTLAEAFHRNMPFIYWRNLVLGDPMAAPHAERPVVSLTGFGNGTVDGAFELSVSTTHSLGVDNLAVFANGVEIARDTVDAFNDCVVLPEGQVQLLVVAQAATDGSTRGDHQPKGWTSVELTVQPGPSDCAEPDAGVLDLGTPDLARPDVGGPDAMQVVDGGVDAGAIDSGPSDSGTAGDTEDGCGCTTTPRSSPGFVVLFALLLLGWRRRHT